MYQMTEQHCDEVRQREPDYQLEGAGPFLWESHTFRQELYGNHDEICFPKTTALFYHGQMPLEEYFDRLIAHLEIDSRRHSFDEAQCTKIEHFLHVDLIAGAIESLMLNRSFRRLTADDATKFKSLCKLAYRLEYADDLRREAESVGTLLDTAPPEWINVLAVIAYARRHIDALSYLVTLRAPAESTFDMFDRILIGTRKLQSPYFQHSANSPQNWLIEIRLWTLLLGAKEKWIHFPRNIKELRNGLVSLLIFPVEKAELRAASEIPKFCEALRDNGIIPWPSALSSYLSLSSADIPVFPNDLVPCNLAQAEMILSYFPLSLSDEITEEGVPNRGASACLLLPLTQWGKNNPDRLVVMRMLLEQGYDPNDKIFLGGWTEFMNRHQADTALHMAAEQGDLAMVELLLEFGARGNIAGYGGEDDTAASRAKTNGHLDIAARLDAGQD